MMKKKVSPDNEKASTMMKDTMVDVREDHMFSLSRDSKPIFRTAHFLKPISNSIDERTTTF